MRYQAHEKLEIVLLVDESHQPIKRTLDLLGILQSTFYVWYDRYLESGVNGGEEKQSSINITT
ncbi:helix-turn-helix domain-containing protein [Pseudovibrio ascidiaceicola]|uniref:helix-turn-helix domain-containing protein n=1 Tax=Pseudovibrio ascidiaceicola TaxID=285279 RepID=UPI00135907A9